MTDELNGLSRRRLLGGAATIGGAAAIGGTGTLAFFSDEETFANNQLTAGELDMKVAYSVHYSDWSDDEDEGIETVSMEPGDGLTGFPAAAEDNQKSVYVSDPGQFLENTQVAEDGSTDCAEGTDADDVEQPLIDLQDVKPGDFGEVTFDFALCDNPGYVWMNGELLDASENGTTEPERKDPDEEEGVVELLDVVQVAVWYDDGDNIKEEDETYLAQGSLRYVLGELESDAGLALEGDLPAEEGGGTGRDCFSASGTHSIGFAWWVPVDHGNEIQTDSATFDIGFYTEQCRHNDGSGMDMGNSDT